jgi:deoxyribose-phosphate aldolase
VTSLNNTDNEKVIQKLIEDVLSTKGRLNIAPAAICVYPNFAKLVSRQLNNTSIKTAVVASAFPHGQASTDIKATEIYKAVEDGAQEIDVVLNRGLATQGNWDYVEMEISLFRDVSRSRTLKVILETCELNAEQIEMATQICLRNEVDFVKTSTGKGLKGAELESSRLILELIRAQFEKTGRRTGFKAAGGIRTEEDARTYWNLVRETLGPDWLDAKYFRIGASSLVENLLNQI